MKRVYLIGITGVGKSTFGQTLANVINFNFLDLDECIAEKTQMSIPEYFEKKGEPAFREVERDCLLSTGDLQKCIIACGGGIVEGVDNREWLAHNGVVISLSRDIQSIMDNIDVSNRPLLKANPDVLQNLYEKRQPLYSELADLTVNIESITDGLKEVIAFLSSQGVLG